MIDLLSSEFRGNILIVDDTPANLQILSDMLRKAGYKARPVPDGARAVKAAESDPPDLILLDITMPGMDGYEVCARLKQIERLKDIPIVFISALTEMPDKVKAFSAGGVDFITKPFYAEELEARLETHLNLRRYQLQLQRYNKSLEEIVQAQLKEITASQMATIFALAKLAESRDDATGYHLERVQRYCRMLAENLAAKTKNQAHITKSFIDDLYHACPLHDIGKVAIPDAILLKPAPVTPAEFEILKKHTVLGAQTLEAVSGISPQNPFVKMGMEVARSHHERWDGRGYPDGLRAEKIPLAARIMSVVDVYDALRAKRCYKPARTHQDSLELIRSERGAAFDPDLVDSFMELEEEFEKTWTE